MKINTISMSYGETRQGPTGVISTSIDVEISLSEGENCKEAMEKVKNAAIDRVRRTLAEASASQEVSLRHLA